MAISRRFLFSAIILLFASIAMVAGCGSSSTPSGSSPQSSQPPTAAAQPSTAPAQVPAPASPTNSVQQPSAFLQVTSPSNDITVNTPTFTVAGIARPGAVVSVNGDLVSVSPTGNFSVDIKLDQGPNDVEVEASDTKGNDETIMRSVIYAP